MTFKKNTPSISADELFRALQERTLSLFSQGLPVQSIPGEHSGLAPGLIHIVNTVERIGRSRSRPFYTVKGSGESEFRSNNLGKHIADALAIPAWWLRQSLALYDVDPRVTLFWTEADRRGLLDSSRVSPWADERTKLTSVDVMNGFVQAVRERYLQEGFRSKLHEHVRATNMKYTEIRKYLMQLLGMFPNLLPVTLGLSYRSGIPSGADNPAQVLKIVAKQMTALAAYAQSVYGDAVVGYAWRQDAIQESGHVGHLLLLLSGTISSNETFALPQAVGRYWVDEITVGEGCFYDNLAAQDSRFRFRGVSPDERRWTPIDEQLRRMAIYLAFTDRFMALKRYPGTKAHGMGKLAKPPAHAPLAPVFPFPQIAGNGPSFNLL